MYKYKIAVCDDSSKTVQEVKALITEWNPSVEVFCFSSGETSLIRQYFWTLIWRG